jgi:hypothetical protein
MVIPHRGLVANMGLSVSGLVLSLLVILLGLPLLAGRGAGFGVALIAVGTLGLVLCIVQGLSAPAVPAPAPPHGTEHRLRELGDLRDKGLISQAEWEERRRALLDGL